MIAVHNVHRPELMTFRFQAFEAAFLLMSGFRQAVIRFMLVIAIAT